MSIRVGLNHFTRYRYDRSIAVAPHVVRLRPAPHCRTPILAYSLKIQPGEHFINWQQDPFGNYLARLVFLQKTRELSFEVDLVADMTVINPFDFFVEEYAQKFPFEYEPALAEELSPYLKIREQGPLLQDWLAAVPRKSKPINDFLVDLNQGLERDIFYNIRMEPGVQACEETLQKASGSCRDSAWLLAQILRHLGLASRFVSGYLVQLTADIKALDGPSGPAQDFTDLHAWTEVYIPGAGWIGLDPTSGLFAAEGHIPLACTPNPGSAAPVTGATDKAEVDFYFHNTVTRIHETPRVAKPYSEEQWQLINALGRQVDVDLAERDVRLTMGGEPTFVSIDDMDSPEWTVAALGEHKRRLAGDLLRRLRQRFGPGGVLHFGQGKWYPGEPVPRWALSCFWRKDGKPLWRAEELLPDAGAVGSTDTKSAQTFITELSCRLGLRPQFVMAAQEDPLYYLWLESGAPSNLDIGSAEFQKAVKDDRERARLARALSQGLDQPAGWVLPLSHDGKRWRSCQWSFRRGLLFLIPGDSPLGLRLPLSSLPWEPPEQRPLQEPRSLFEPQSPLPDVHGEVAQRYSYWESQAPTSPLKAQTAKDTLNPADMTADHIVHTALCVQVREGRLYVFLPPLTHLEYYLDLLASIEQTAQAMQQPVYLEGYEPPPDPRLLKFSLSPDPGVLEVNIHPAARWDELVENTETLYEEARQARLGTEKFMLDGRHTGTGGGNHITLGGPTPADSPLLRRPDLLRSLVTYWQHHPGLSYLFSGLFIGPTSQSPRVDEARHEAVYELEIALQRIPEGVVPQPWLVDRLLRYLLVDLTGNTHRAEFCIDKLYSPDSSTGRLGLLEMRAFEMPPHARMSLVQMLLVRALVARFWREPYAHKLVRWGTALHDRFMLPHYVYSDLNGVAAELQKAGYEFQAEWLDPFFEFRFPHYGEVQIDDVKLELRMGLEPWHVLGEEVTGGGTARFVDSSVERLQVKVSGMSGERYVVTCNRRRLPLQATGTVGEYVAGVRYRAWQPPSALHPTIPVHVPLVLDIIDTWNGRSIGGCTYHVSHPGGRNFEDFPVNANAAEARRTARFFDFGHTPGPITPPPVTQRLVKFLPQGSPPQPMQPPVEEPNGDYPYTLDLRR